MSTTPGPNAALPPPPAEAGVPVDLAALQAAGFPGFPAGIDGAQIMQILKNLPQYNKLDEGQREDAAQALSQFQQAQAQAAQGFRVSEPGPSSHPHGPPPGAAAYPGSLSVPVATAVLPGPGPSPSLGSAPMTAASGGDDDDEGDAELPDAASPTAARTGKTPGGRRGRGGALPGSEEWTRQRKDNHKEVERRRRGNINDGINELGRIVPSGSGEKAKGAILSRAVQYIHHLKENEARNIEKWTLEKLLMDQAMGDLQVQLDEIRRMWEEERQGRVKAEQELEALTGKSVSKDGVNGASTKRGSMDEEEEEEEEGSEGENASAKKARTES
ncbi:BHLH domain-containing protein [Mycena kentingensis (nom. inval.)]|nr:BHLH domain-containing protein [Mycena kentingensis (nom. inval.)]